MDDSDNESSKSKDEKLVGLIAPENKLLLTLAQEQQISHIKGQGNGEDASSAN